ncbi:MAG TPA: hypothetical protein VGH65_02640 [Verrucomicrobiaceae bacterium]
MAAKPVEKVCSGMSSGGEQRVRLISGQKAVKCQDTGLAGVLLAGEPGEACIDKSGGRKLLSIEHLVHD